MTTLTVHPSTAGLRGTLRVPGDKSISHRALLMSALAEGTSTLTGLSTGADVAATEAAIAAFGADVSRQGTVVRVRGGGLHEPPYPIDVGNSGTGIRLMTGVAAGIDGLSVFYGDESIARRPMGRVVEPLRAMGAGIDGRDRGRLPPLAVRGGNLHGLDYQLPVASAQVKGAILLAGLRADGPTTVREPSPTRVHTEQMLAERGIALESGAGWVKLQPGPLAPCDTRIPGDPSQAAFWVVAACLVPGSDLTVEGVYLGPRRAGFLDVLARMGADITVEGPDPATSVGTVRARHGQLRATEVGGEEIPGLIDEIPVLAVAAAFAEGTTVFRDAEELKVKESDRIATMVGALRSVGVAAEGYHDGLAVTGRSGGTAGGVVDSAGDHRVAMALAVAALAGTGPVVIDRWEAVATSYPGFEEDMARCQM